MQIKSLVHQWFDKWKEGDFYNLPISEDFKHSSPFGTIDGKEAYLKLVESNKEKFLVIALKSTMRYMRKRKPV